MDFKLIIAALKPGVTDVVVDAAKAAGATGATIITGRGTGVHEAKTFFGLKLEAQTDVVLFVVAVERIDSILRAIAEDGKLSEPGVGVAFVLPIEGAVGFESQVAKVEGEKKTRTD